jgi:single-strand DNA-binding protein
MVSLNKVVLCGQVADPSLKLTYSAEGSPQCSFTMRLDEAGKDGQVFKLFIPVEVFSTHAEWVAAHVNAGDLILIDGNLRWQSWVDKKGEKQDKLAVMAWQISLLAVAMPTASSANEGGSGAPAIL